MEDGASTPNATMLQTANTLLENAAFDYSLMDEILYDGFWLETSNFWQQQLTSTDLNNDPNTTTTTTTDLIDHLTANPLTEIFLDPKMDEYYSSKNDEATVSSPTIAPDDSERNPSNLSSLWVGPNRNNSTVRARLVQAINYLKDSIRDKDVLIQIWVPVKIGNKQVLTTNDQLFALKPGSKNLAEYRDASRSYHFAAEKDSQEHAGLPGRVFMNKLPEWTPDVRFFKREEYPRVNHAQQCDVRGSLALPVFQRGSGKCLGVVEIVTTSQKVKYGPELENVCKALEAFDLKSSNNLIPENADDEDCYGPYQSALMEIKNILKCVCEAHDLPLAQAWAPCSQQGKGGCRHSEENYARCVSTIDFACCVTDPNVSAFHEACSEHHLLKGEGVVGRAFLTNQPCFASDVTIFSKSEYPLAHHARLFNLHSAVAIRLRSTQTGTSDFVLELFLPVNCRHEQDQRLMLDALSSVIQRTCQSLRVVTDDELALEDVSGRETSNSGSLSRDKGIAPPWMVQQKKAAISGHGDKGKGVADTFDLIREEGKEEFKVVTAADWGSSELDFFGQQQHQRSSFEKKRAKTEKTISLEMLRQYFAGSLKDAAKSIGVCPTTLKRICRQHGITRWPSRKIKKVGHSLKKLQRVIDSVEGVGGSIQLRSFYNSFPELATSDLPERSNNTASKRLWKNSSERTFATPPSNSASSSGSHSSSSSFSLSNGAKPEETAGAEGNLKRARSDAELAQDLGKGDERVLLRSYSSHKITSYGDEPSQPPPAAGPRQRGNNGFRVKASFGEEKVRFSLPQQWSFDDLRREVLRRFNLLDGNGGRIDIKYLDDDSEWVLLTCDSDLEECVDIHLSFKTRAIKLCLTSQACNNQNLGSSIDSNGPS